MLLGLRRDALGPTRRIPRSPSSTPCSGASAGDPSRRRAHGARELRRARRRRASDRTRTASSATPNGAPTGRRHARRGRATGALGRPRRSTTTRSRSSSSARRPWARRAASPRSTRCPMPHWLGLRDLQVFLGHRRTAARWTPCPIVATMDIPQVIDLGLAGDRRRPAGGRLDRRPDRGADRLRTPTRDGSGTTLPRRRRAGGVLPRRPHGRPAGGRPRDRGSGDRAGARARGSGCTTRSIRANGGTSARGGTASSTSRWRRTPQIERAAMLGLAVSVQPAFDRLLGTARGAVRDRRSGRSARRAMNPFRTMLERGIEVGAGSDTPITPFDPLLVDRAPGACTTTRRNDSPESRRSGCTRWAARALGHQEEKKGVARARDARGLRGVRRRSARRRLASKGSRPILTVSLGREVFAALSGPRRRGDRRRRDRRFVTLCRPARLDRSETPRAVPFASRHRPGGGAR